MKRDGRAKAVSLTSLAPGTPIDLEWVACKAGAFALFFIYEIVLWWVGRDTSPVYQALGLVGLIALCVFTFHYPPSRWFE